MNAFGNMMQQQQEQQEKPKEQEAAEQATPSKKWGKTKSVSQDAQAAAEAFVGKTQVPELARLFERLHIEGERSATLNLERIGLAALALGKYEIAEKALDAALARIDLVYADNPEAQKAKSLWNAEQVKDFKGEPYERAMAYFYRGLLYATRGDFQNARAMFKQADYQDTVAETEKYVGDFALMPYMAGWASYCDGNSNLAKDFLQAAIKGDERYADMNVEHPLVALIETGRVPFKYGGGRYGERLQWAPREHPGQSVKACTPGTEDCRTDKLIIGADVGFQATTRGGRPIDSVLNGKASFKEGAQDVADVATAIGAAGLQMASTTGSRDAAGLGAFGMLAGLVAQGVSSATQAQADIREWEQLPGTIWLGTGAKKHNAAAFKIAVETSGTTNQIELVRLVQTPSCQLYWGRTLSPTSVLGDAGPIEPGEHPRDQVFRQEMESTFGV